MGLDAERLLRSLYENFNARDADAVLAATTPDVDWPNAWEGGRVHGRAAVRAYWTRVVHVYELRDGLVARMTVEDTTSASEWR